MSSKEKLTIGMVIYDELTHLDRALMQLQNEVNHHIPDRNINWIFVLNHNNQELRADILSIIQKHLTNFQYFENQFNNLGLARNIILNKAETNLIYFTDPDIEHCPKTLSSLIGFAEMNLTNEKIIGFTGPVIHKSKCLTMNEMFKNLQSLSQKIPFSFQIQNHIYLNTVDHAPTCHLLVIKKTALEILGFSAQIESVGEDLDFSHRTYGANLRFLFSPNAPVIHHQNMNFRSWLQKVSVYGRAQIMVHKKNSDLPYRLYRLLPILLLIPLIVFLFLPINVQFILFILLSAIFIYNRSLFYVFLTGFSYAIGEVFELFWPKLKLKNVKEQTPSPENLSLSSFDSTV
jgi:hypothetical protein